MIRKSLNGIFEGFGLSEDEILALADPRYLKLDQTTPQTVIGNVHADGFNMPFNEPGYSMGAFNFTDVPSGASAAFGVTTGAGIYPNPVAFIYSSLLDPLLGSPGGNPYIIDMVTGKFTLFGEIESKGPFSFNNGTFYVTPNNAVCVVPEGGGDITSDGGGPSFLLGPYGESNPGRLSISGDYAEFVMVDRGATSFAPDTTWRMFPQFGNFIFWRNGDNNTLNFTDDGKIGWGNFYDIGTDAAFCSLDLLNRALLLPDGTSALNWNSSDISVPGGLTIGTEPYYAKLSGTPFDISWPGVPYATFNMFVGRNDIAGAAFGISTAGDYSWCNGPTNATTLWAGETDLVMSPGAGMPTWILGDLKVGMDYGGTDLYVKGKGQFASASLLNSLAEETMSLSSEDSKITFRDGSSIGWNDPGGLIVNSASGYVGLHSGDTTTPGVVDLFADDGFGGSSYLYFDGVNVQLEMGDTQGNSFAIGTVSNNIYVNTTDFNIFCENAIKMNSYTGFEIWTMNEPIPDFKVNSLYSSLPHCTAIYKQSEASSRFEVNGSFALKYNNKSANYTLTIDDSVINCTANTFTVTLPTAVGITGRIYTVKNSGTGTITLATTSSQTIDGATTKTLAQYKSYTVQSTGSAWIIIGAV